MTYGEVPGKAIFGRPFKPLAVGLIIGSTNIIVDRVAVLLIGHPTLVISTPYASLLALLGTVLMMGAWLARSQNVYEVGLLLTVGAWVTRAMEITLLGEYASAVSPFSFAVMAGGAYWLERASSFRSGIREMT